LKHLEAWVTQDFGWFHFDGTTMGLISAGPAWNQMNICAKGIAVCLNQQV
jgi:hypothetical protein